MKITQIEAFKIEYTIYGGKGFKVSLDRVITVLPAIVVKVSTDEGISGYGEIGPIGSTYAEAYFNGIVPGLQELGPQLLGKDPREVKKIADFMDMSFAGHSYVKTPLDVACWDIFGKSTGLSVATLLGGRKMEKYPIWGLLGRQHTPETMADAVAEFQTEGYSMFQVKVGGEVNVDAARVRAARKAIGDDELVFMDANTGWLSSQALSFLNMVDDLDVIMEQPCASYEECLYVRKNSKVPLVLDEVITSLKVLLKAYQDGAMDGFNLKIARFGGLTGAKTIRDVGEKLGYGMTIEDFWGGDITSAAICALIGSTEPAHYKAATDYPSTVDISVAEDAPRMKDGYMPVPDGPGLGIQVDDKRLGKAIATIK